MKTQLIAFFAFSLASLAQAGEGQVAIRCLADGSGGLQKIEFIETDLKGQYVISQSFRDRPDAMIVNEEGLYRTTTYAEIRDSEKTENGIDIPMESIWGMPTVLRMHGLENMAAVVQDCNEVTLRLTCTLL